jgi:CRISPR system Cascade subunit CasD
VNTLLLQLIGPMQSWGVQSAHENRDTGREPSKSGVIGLLCAALGRPRDADLSDLNQLRMGVRVDREGRLAVDYQTIQTLDPGGKVRETKVSRRWYLADAAFLVGLEADQAALLEQLQRALQAPAWPLCLGRKAFVPGAPVWLEAGLRRSASLVEALLAYPRLVPDGGEPGARLRLVLDDPQGTIIRPDLPVSFATRSFLPRRMSVRLVALPAQEVA